MSSGYHKLIPKGVKIILFDGVCNLCDQSVQFIIKRDVKKQFRYASLDSDLGKKLLSERGIDRSKIDSIVLIDPNTAYYVKSSAALEISKQLKGWPTILQVFLIFPSWMRDPIYDFIAKNRYRWFGKKDACMIPDPSFKSLFLDLDN